MNNFSPEDSIDRKLEDNAMDILDAFLVKLISLPIGFSSPSSELT